MSKMIAEVTTFDSSNDKVMNDVDVRLKHQLHSLGIDRNFVRGRPNCHRAVNYFIGGNVVTNLLASLERSRLHLDSSNVISLVASREMW